MPFWRGEGAGRSAELGEAVGALCREIAAPARRSRPPPLARARVPARPGRAARMLRDYVVRQNRLARRGPRRPDDPDRDIRDPAGELGLAVLTPFGGKLHHGAEAGAARPAPRASRDHARLPPRRRRPPVSPAETGRAAARPVRRSDRRAGRGPDPRRAAPRPRCSGSGSARTPGGRCLMPRPDPAKRTPLWLQRLRAKDLLQVVRRFPDFPIVRRDLSANASTTTSTCPASASSSTRSRRGSIRVVRRRGEIASPFASELIFQFTAAYLYEWDEPRTATASPRRRSSTRTFSTPLLRDGDRPTEWLDPRPSVASRTGCAASAGRRGPPTRWPSTCAWLGDLSDAELSGPMLAFLDELHEAAGRRDRARRHRRARRWIAAEEVRCTARPSRRGQGGWVQSTDHKPTIPVVAPTLRTHPRRPARRSSRFLQTHALIGLADLTARYPIGSVEAAELLERWAEEGRRSGWPNRIPVTTTRWAERDNLTEMRRVTVAVRRGEPRRRPRGLRRLPAAAAARPSGLARGGPGIRRGGAGAAPGFAAPARQWETEILPRRVKDYRPAWLDLTS